jgi:hypothetical protein
MKLPSLDTAEGVVVLAAAGLIAYVIYKATKLPGAIGDTLSGAASTIGHIPSQINEAANSDSNPLKGIGDWIGSHTYDLTHYSDGPGLGTSTSVGSIGSDSHTVSKPQDYSPSSLNDLVNANLTNSSEVALAQADLVTSEPDVPGGDW